MEQQRPRRVLGYCRVSSDAQGRTGTSLAAQRDEIAKHCAALGWPAPRFFIESKSAGGEDLAEREEARALLSEARPGDYLVVTKQDRWTRHALFYMQSMKALAAAGVTFHAISEPYDREKPEGRFSANVSASMSEFERERIIERTVGRRQALRDDGCWTEGVAPLGYTRDKSRRLVIQPDEAAIVRDIYARCIRGESLATIARALREVGAKRVRGKPTKWDRAAINRILRKRWYVGEIRRTDGTWQAAHRPIVTVAQFDRAAKALEGRRHSGREAKAPRTENWLLRGIASCGGCGSRMGAAYGPKGWGREYYACAGRVRGTGCDQPYAHVDTTDAQADAAMVARLEELRHELAKVRPSKKPKGFDDLGAIEDELAKARQRRARTVSLHVDGTITKEDLQTRVAKIDKEIVRLEHRLAEVGSRARARLPEVRAEVLADVEQVRKAWRRMTPSKKRTLLASFAIRVTVDRGAVHVEWKDVEDLTCAS